MALIYGPNGKIDGASKSYPIMDCLGYILSSLQPKANKNSFKFVKRYFFSCKATSWTEALSTTTKRKGSSTI